MRYETRGKRGIDSRHNFAANLTISRSSSGGKNGEECELPLALSTWWAVAEKLQSEARLHLTAKP
jgi:hypothetical protein